MLTAGMEELFPLQKNNVVPTGTCHVNILHSSQRGTLWRAQQGKARGDHGGQQRGIWENREHCSIRSSVHPSPSVSTHPAQMCPSLTPWQLAYLSPNIKRAISVTVTWSIAFILNVPVKLTGYKHGKVSLEKVYAVVQMLTVTLPIFVCWGCEGTLLGTGRDSLGDKERLCWGQEGTVWGMRNTVGQ